MEKNAEWFVGGRFGMFVHWGLYSNPAGVWQGTKAKHPYSEWLQGGNQVPRAQYQRLAEQFNPTNFDADQWIAEAKRAGMRYFLITAKHHDGFALWPTKASAYNVMDATPFKRDILGELAAACRTHGITLGFYYSHWQDWEGTGGDICSTYLENAEYQHPSEAEFEQYWQNKCLVQVRELLTQYHPKFLWFDTWNEDSYPFITDRRQDQLIDLIKSIDPDCLVNSRIQFLKPSPRVDYLSMMDNVFPDTGFDKPWETSGTLNHSWGYHALDFDWKSTRQLIQFLVGNAALGGNYQLNVGPTGDGRFQPAAIRRLREIGAWLQVNGEAVYGTVADDLAARAGLARTKLSQPWGRITVRRTDEGTAVRCRYLHLWEFTAGQAIRIAECNEPVLAATVLETGQPVEAAVDAGGTWVALPRELAGLNLPVIRLQYR